jgi:hypothetical protein
MQARQIDWHGWHARRIRFDASADARVQLVLTALRP